ncbi:hypothetical protein ACU686_41660 [Yinghuangia aomiensis]
MTNLPRRRLLDIWKVLAARSARPGDEGPADAQDALYDTERLVCLLYPAMRMPALGLREPGHHRPGRPRRARALRRPPKPSPAW